MTNLENFRYQPFVAVSGNPGVNVPVVDDVLSSHEQEIYPTTSLDENSIAFEFQTDRNVYVDLRQTCLALKIKPTKGRGFDTYKTTEKKKDHKEETVFTEFDFNERCYRTLSPSGIKRSTTENGAIL